jgi:hypothetical protein
MVSIATTYVKTKLHHFSSLTGSSNYSTQIDSGFMVPKKEADITACLSNFLHHPPGFFRS